MNGPTEPVTIAWVHQTEVAHSWATSMLSLQAALLGAGVECRYIAMRGGTGNLVEARNRAVATFLDGDQDWLFWIDTDMGFHPDIVGRLWRHADPVERPVVGALAFASKETDSDERGGFYTFPVPTLYRWGKWPSGKTGFSSWHEYPRGELVQVDGTGSACILIHRRVFEEIGGGWYDRVPDPNEPGQQISEDLSFCLRCAGIGAPIHVDTSVETTHLKPQWVGRIQHEQALVLREAHSRVSGEEPTPGP